QRVVSAALPAGAGALGALLKRAGEIGAEDAQRRDEPANNAGEQTDREGEKQNFRIKLRFVKRLQVGRNKRREHAKANECEEQTRSSAEESEQCAFGKKL